MLKNQLGNGMDTFAQDLFLHVEVSHPLLSEILAGDYRLDACYYSKRANRARESFAEASLPSIPISSIADVFALSDFSLFRIPAANEKLGVPFYTFSDIEEFNPQPTMFLSKRLEPNLDDYLVQKGWVLISRAGTIGKVVLVGAELHGKAVSNHAIRIIPRDSEMGALIYTALSGELGRDIVKSCMYGSVVDVIKPFQINSIKIPLPPKKVVNLLSSKVQEALSARSSARNLLHEAEGIIYEINGLPRLKTEDLKFLNNLFEVETFETSSKIIWQLNSEGSEYRMEAHFYNPLAQLAVKNLKPCRSEVKPLHEVTERIILGPRFKRNYVEADHGLPFLSGRNIVQIRPELKYLSNVQVADMQELIIKEGWTLVTCSGTIGRTCFVWRNYEDYAASQHILRVVPDTGKIDPGYLYAFLSSRYGYEQILRYRYGSVIDEITDKQIGKVLIPLPSKKDQKLIGEKVRLAYEKRAEALHLEDEAQEILMKELTIT